MGGFFFQIVKCSTTYQYMYVMYYIYEIYLLPITDICSLNSLDFLRAKFNNRSEAIYLYVCTCICTGTSTSHGVEYNTYLIRKRM